jgi:hypothetical protein
MAKASRTVKAGKPAASSKVVAKGAAKKRSRASA